MWAPGGRVDMGGAQFSGVWEDQPLAAPQSEHEPHQEGTTRPSKQAAIAFIAAVAKAKVDCLWRSYLLPFPNQRGMHFALETMVQYGEVLQQHNVKWHDLDSDQRMTLLQFAGIVPPTGGCPCPSCCTEVCDGVFEFTGLARDCKNLSAVYAVYEGAAGDRGHGFKELTAMKEQYADAVKAHAASTGADYNKQVAALEYRNQALRRKLRMSAMQRGAVVPAAGAGIVGPNGGGGEPVVAGARGVDGNVLAVVGSVACVADLMRNAGFLGGSNMGVGAARR